MLLMALTCTASADWTYHQVIDTTALGEVARSVVLDVDSTTPPHGYFAFDVWAWGTPSQGTPTLLASAVADASGLAVLTGVAPWPTACTDRVQALELSTCTKSTAHTTPP